jgi:hypothetical protein
VRILRWVSLNIISSGYSPYNCRSLMAGSESEFCIPKNLDYSLINSARNVSDSFTLSRSGQVNKSVDYSNDCSL